MSTRPLDSDLGRASSDEIEVERIENDLADLLRTQYGVAPADLELTRGQEWALTARSRESIARILAEPQRSEHRSTLKHRMWAVGVAAAAAAVLAPLVWPFGNQGSTAYSATPPPLDIVGVDAVRYPLIGTDPDRELDRLAHLARTSPAILSGLSSGVGLGRGQSGDAQHLEVDSWWLETSNDGRPSSEVVPTETQRYVLPGGSVRVTTTTGSPLTGRAAAALSPSSGRAARAQGGAVSAAAGSPTGPLSHPSRLPLDPAKLRARLLGDPRQCADREGACLSEAIQTLGQSNLLSPRLNAALLRTLIGAPDVRYVGSTLDRAGRPSEVFVVDDPDHARQRLILFDADTGAYNGDETVLLKGGEDLGVETPAVIGFDVVVTREWVEAGAVPVIRSTH